MSRSILFEISLSFRAIFRRVGATIRQVKRKFARLKTQGKTQGSKCSNNRSIEENSRHEMEYPPAFRLQDKTTGKHDLRHMTKHEQFFLSVSDTVIRVQLGTDSIQFFIPSKK